MFSALKEEFALSLSESNKKENRLLSLPLVWKRERFVFFSPDRGIAIVESANPANWSSSGSHLLLA